MGQTLISINSCLISGSITPIPPICAPCRRSGECRREKELNVFREISEFREFSQPEVRLSSSKETLFVTLVTEVSLISREPNLRFERISISRGFLCKSFSSFPFYTRHARPPAASRCSRSSSLSRHSMSQFFSLLPALKWRPIWLNWRD